MSPVDDFFQQYKVAAGEGAVLELKYRILADKIPVLEYTVKDDFKEIETKVAEYFFEDLSEGDRDTLVRCRELRNKVIHCDFSKVRVKLQQLGAQPTSGNVLKIDIRGMSGVAMVERMGAGVAREPGTFKEVAALSTNDGGVFGWLLELGSAGDFLKAIAVFKAASALVERLLVLADEP